MSKRLYILLFTILSLFLLSLTSYCTQVSAKSCVLVECESGEIVFSKNEKKRMPMASTTKIMTAIVVIENCDLEKSFKIPKEATGIEGSSIYLCEGEALTVSELLYALLLESANDASVALAYATCGDLDIFVDLMNKKAQALGLENTHFTNPHGLDNEEHYTTAYDLATLCRYAMENPIFEEICSTYKKTIPLNNGEGTRVLINHNRLLKSYEGAIGIKTGFTQKSGRCLCSCAEIDDVRLICVTLNAPNDWSDHKTLFDYGFSQYESVKFADTGDYTLSLGVINGEKSTLMCSNFEPFKVTLKRKEHNFRAVFEYDRLLFAPIKQGEAVGKIVFFDGDEKIGELELFALENVKNIKYKKSILERLFGNGKD